MKAPQMNRSALAIIAGGVFVALALGFPATAAAAPSGIGSAQDTVDELENHGFNVVLSKMGPGPLDHCTVDSVRPGTTVIHPVRNGGDVVDLVIYQTVYLTAKR